MEERRKPKEDELWLMRKLISRPCFNVLRLLLIKSPRTKGEIYDYCERPGSTLTRKTVIATIRTLSMNLKVIKPESVRDNRGYVIGYSLPPAMAEIIRAVIADAKKLDEEMK